MRICYDALIDNENKMVWFWLPTSSTAKLFGVKKVDMTEKISKGSWFTVKDLSQILRREDMITKGYEREVCFKGEEPEEFWKLFARAQGIPLIEEDKSVF
jgi:hypothetical protein